MERKWKMKEELGLCSSLCIGGFPKSGIHFPDFGVPVGVPNFLGRTT